MIQTRILLWFYCIFINSRYMGTMLSILLMFTDIDECALETDRCDQDCHNAVGNYTCSCRTGYTLSGRFTCLSEQEKTLDIDIIYTSCEKQLFTRYWWVCPWHRRLLSDLCRYGGILHLQVSAGVHTGCWWTLLQWYHAWLAVGAFRYRRESHYFQKRPVIRVGWSTTIIIANNKQQLYLRIIYTCAMWILWWSSINI